MRFEKRKENFKVEDNILTVQKWSTFHDPNEDATQSGCLCEVLAVYNEIKAIKYYCIVLLFFLGIKINMCLFNMFFVFFLFFLPPLARMSNSAYDV